MQNTVKPPTELCRILMQRDNLTREEAEEQIAEAKAEIADGLDPEEALEDMGLEPDYIFDLIDL